MGFGSSKPKLKQNQKLIIDEQQQKSICKIRINYDDIGYGFLALSPLTNKKILVAKIDSSYFLSKENDIKLIINNKDPILLMSNEQRIIYSNGKFNITILELKESDGINEDNFLHFDFDGKENNNMIRSYKGKEIYIIPYKTKSKIIYPLGKIVDIEDNEKFVHDCKDLDKDLIPFPVFSLDNYKIIGINESINKGIFLKNILDEFNELVKKEEDDKKEKKEKKKENDDIIIKKKLSSEIRDRINENKSKMNQIKKGMKRNIGDNNLSMENNEKNIMILIIVVNPEDVGNEVYFLDNYKYINPQNKKRETGFMKEIKDLKEKVILTMIKPNDERIQIPFDNKFIPKEEGNHIIEIEVQEQIEDFSYMFYGCTNIIDIDLSNFDFQSTRIMNDMFNYCINLVNIRFPQSSIENVINTSYMFNYCKKLLKIDLSNMNTENVISMAGMFQHCESLESLDLSNFDIKNNTQLSCMFNDCYELNEIIFSAKFNTKNVMFMPWMFYGCENLSSLDLTMFKFDEKIIRDMSQMFNGCDKLEEIKINEENKNIFLKTNHQMSEKFKL
jgi:surface protein